MDSYDYVLRAEIEDVNICREVTYWKNPLWRLGIPRKWLLKQAPEIAL
jgi:hypothetical protein